MASRSLPILLLLIISALISCDPKEEVIPAPEPFPSLSIFADRFLAEARARGYELDISGLDLNYVDGKITPGDGKEYCGFGWVNFPGTGRRQVFISRDPSCGFATISDLKREQFLFHEIGHAFLNLQHDNSLLCDGRPLSLMHEFVDRYEYYEDSPENKKYYLDELFDRLAAEAECIDYGKDFTVDPVFFRHQGGDDRWIFHNAQGSFSGSRVTQSAPYALIINSIPGKISQETGYWYSQIGGPNIPENAKVSLRTKVYSEGLNGPGVAIGLRIYEAPLSNNGAQTVETAVFTTENDPVSGTLNGQILELTFPNFTRRTIIMIPFAVMMPGTEGVARFEDFEIIVQN